MKIKTLLEIMDQVKAEAEMVLAVVVQVLHQVVQLTLEAVEAEAHRMVQLLAVEVVVE